MSTELSNRVSIGVLAYLAIGDRTDSSPELSDTITVSLPQCIENLKVIVNHMIENAPDNQSKEAHDTSRDRK